MRFVTSPPISPVEPVTDFLHGIPVTDPYRWLEEQDSPRTRAWVDAQTRYARAHLDRIPNREQMRERVRDLLDAETRDFLLVTNGRYFFRKRLPRKEQPCIYMRASETAEDQLLLDPVERGTGKYTAVLPRQVSRTGRFLLYEVKQGGERPGVFEILDVETRQILKESLPHGYLRGFLFSPDEKSFHYIHERSTGPRPNGGSVLRHVIGTEMSNDECVFTIRRKNPTRMSLLPGEQRMGILVTEFTTPKRTSLFLRGFSKQSQTETVITDWPFHLGPRLAADRIFASTNRNAPNSRIVELIPGRHNDPDFIEVIPETAARITAWCISSRCFFVTYIRETKTEIAIFDFSGRRLGQLPVDDNESVTVLCTAPDGEELFVETESFTAPPLILRYSLKGNRCCTWFDRNLPIGCRDVSCLRVYYQSKDGTEIPMSLVGRDLDRNSGVRPTVMTSYGGYGLAMTPQFSVFISILLEKGSLFALPHIRGGSEFGAGWHEAGKRGHRQNAFDDFLAAAEWLIDQKYTDSTQLAVFGGSNSGLLVGAAVTQKPALFRAGILMVPLLDMVRYHLFDQASLWREEFGTVEDAEDFAALLAYSPYHNVRDGTEYPALLLVSGDADTNCNPLHARKMTARLQAANASENPILLAYSKHRGHSPVLPLSDRIEALTDRILFVSEFLRLETHSLGDYRELSRAQSNS
jgi:prolyl oligopeptidase